MMRARHAAAPDTSWTAETRRAGLARESRFDALSSVRVRRCAPPLPLRAMTLCVTTTTAEMMLRAATGRACAVTDTRAQPESEKALCCGRPGQKKRGASEGVRACGGGEACVRLAEDWLLRAADSAV
eukprot:6124506-Pleurochrysis_carterae.AAC.1